MISKGKENIEGPGVVNAVYIMDQSGALLFSYEDYKQGSKENSIAVLSHFLFALQSAASQVKSDQNKTLEMGNNRYFLTKEPLKNLLFIIKTLRDVNADLIYPILKEIRKKFMDKLAEQPFLHLDEKMQVYESFKGEIDKILKRDTNLDQFLKDL